MANVATSASWQNTLEPILKAYFVDEYAKFQSLIPVIFDVTKSTKAQETYLGTSGVKNFVKKNGAVTPSEIAETNKVVISNDTWVQALEIEQELYEDEQYPIMKGMMRDMALSARRTKEQDAFGIFNHAFDTTFLGGDGLSLCNNAHTSPIVGVANQDNYLALALNYANFVTARNTMRKFKDWNGEVINLMPDTLVVPIDLQEAALVIAESILKPGTPNNDVNVVNKVWKLDVVCSPFLDNASAWFVLDSAASKNHLHFQERTPLQLGKDQSPETYNLRMMGRYRTGLGFSDWRFAVGSQA